jgi:hypothetical protein
MACLHWLVIQHSILYSVNFPLSPKTWGLRCLPCNVPSHLHLRQLRDVIQAQFKDEGVVLCDVSFGGNKSC